nr:hypothetical protein [Paracoccus sanguinis]
MLDPAEHRPLRLVEQPALEIVERPRQQADADPAPGGAQPGEDVHAAQHVDADRGLRVALVKEPQRLVEDLGGPVGDHRDLEPRPRVASVRPDPFDRALHRHRLGVDRGPGLGQGKVAGAAVHEHGVERRLEPGERLADRGLAEAQPLGGAGDAAGLADGGKDPEQVPAELVHPGAISARSGGGRQPPRRQAAGRR